MEPQNTPRQREETHIASTKHGRIYGCNISCFYMTDAANADAESFDKHQVNDRNERRNGRLETSTHSGQSKQSVYDTRLC